MDSLNKSPSRFSTVVALVGCGVAVAAMIGVSWSAGGISVFASGVLLLGLLRSSGRLLSISFAILWVAVVVASVQNAASELILICVVAGIISWDTGQRAIKLGQEMTSDALTRPVEILHAGATIAVGVASITIAYSLYLILQTKLPSIFLFSLTISVLIFVLILSWY